MIDFQFDFGTCYHLYCAGNAREAIFRFEEDYYSFIKLFQKYLNSIAYLYAYCLLPTHFHLLFRIKEKKKIEYVYSERELLRLQFRYFFAAYEAYFNRTYQRSGFLFNGRTPRKIPRKMDLLCTLIVYIHQNPQIHGIVSDFRYWPFSSCYAYLRQDRRSLIAKEILLNPAYHKQILENQQMYDRG